jgi:hypothetical protein
MCCVLLAIDRFFEILFPKVGKIIFGKTAMYFWLAVPPCYMFYYTFYIPAFFNVIHHAFYFDPYYGVKGLENNPLVNFFVLVTTRSKFNESFNDHDSVVVRCSAKEIGATVTSEGSVPLASKRFYSNTWSIGGLQQNI